MLLDSIVFVRFSGHPEAHEKILPGANKANKVPITEFYLRFSFLGHDYLLYKLGPRKTKAKNKKHIPKHLFRF